MTRRGFTLIELLIVIVILGILGTIGAWSFTKSLKVARDGQRKNDLAQIARALELYYNDKSRYPLGDSDGLIIGCEAGDEGCRWGKPFEIEDESVYMPKLPQDPQNNQKYYYWSSNGKYYELYALLEVTDDAAAGNYPNTSGWCGGVGNPPCNYQVASAKPSDSPPQN